MNVIERLKEERSKLNQRLAQVEALLAQHQDFELRAVRLLGAEVDNLVDTYRDAPASSGEPPESVAVLGQFDAAASHRAAPKPTANERRNVSADVRAFEAIVLDILAHAARPMDRTELLSEVTRQGMMVPGKDPSNTLGARMSRMPGVVNVREGGLRGYWLEDRRHELLGALG